MFDILVAWKMQENLKKCLLGWSENLEIWEKFEKKQERKKDGGFWPLIFVVGSPCLHGSDMDKPRWQCNGSVIYVAPREFFSLKKEQQELQFKVQGAECPEKKFREQIENFGKIQGAKG